MTDTIISPSSIVQSGLSKTPLSEDSAAAFRELIDTWKIVSKDSPDGKENESGAINRMQSIFTLLWGEEGQRMLMPPNDRPESASPADATADFSGEGEVAEAPMTMSLTQCNPAQLKARLRRLFATGRCSRDQYVKMSLAPSGRARTLLANAEPLPAGSFGDSAELSEVHARRVANWACGGRR